MSVDGTKTSCVWKEQVLMNLEQFKIDLAVGVRRTLERIGKTKLMGEKMMIPCRGGEVDVYLYRAEQKGAPILFDLHGGGFVYGHGADEELFCDRLRTDLNINVISINYRKAPKYPYPAAVEDVFDVICHWREHGEKYQMDGGRLAVIGHSAGGNLAAVAAMMGKESGKYQLCCQILNYPFLDVLSNPADKPKYPEALPVLLVKAFSELYAKPEERALPHISPALCSPEELKGLPPAAVLVAEYDSLREEGERYARLLYQAEVPVTCRCICGIGHGFIEHYFARGVYDRMPEEPNRILPQNIEEKIADSMDFIEGTLREYLLK